MEIWVTAPGSREEGDLGRSSHSALPGWDGAWQPSYPSVGRAFGCARSNLFWGRGGWLFFFFLLNIITPSLGTFQKYNLEKNGAGGEEGPFGSQPDGNSCPAEVGLQYQPPFLPFPGDFEALHPPTPAQLILVAPWGHLPHETMATGQWGHRERWQECPHHMSWKQEWLCRLICCLCPSQWQSCRTGLASPDQMSYFYGSRGWWHGHSC